MSEKQVYMTLPYFGGKGSHGPLAQWIREIIGNRTDQTWVEPFAGFLGVMLVGAQSKQEVANGISNHIVTWWKHVRDNTDEFLFKLYFTPRSEVILKESAALLKGGGDGSIDHALAVHAYLCLGFNRSLEEAEGTFCLKRDPKEVMKKRIRCEAIPRLAARIQNLIILNRDALDVIRFFQPRDDAMIYCDPPYRGATGFGKLQDFNRDRMGELLLQCKGRVAISGYGDTWDHLGFDRHEFSSYTSHLSKRTEILWTNFDKPQLDMFA